MQYIPQPARTLQEAGNYLVVHPVALHLTHNTTCMPQEVLDYIATQRVGVLAVEMPDGSPHGATVHFAHSTCPIMFWFETNKEYRKTEALVHRPTSRASFVIGFDEIASKTLQLDGVVRLLNSEAENDTFKTIYLHKFPDKVEKAKDHKFTPFLFTPTWWRYTDWTKLEGKLILSSEQINI